MDTSHAYVRILNTDSNDGPEEALEEHDEYDKVAARTPKTDLQAFVESTPFQSIIGVVIAANATIIGFETDHPEYWMWPVLEDLFLFVFFLELTVRVWAYGLHMFFNVYGPDATWNYFDFLIVSLGCGDHVMSMFVNSSNASETRHMSMLIRSFRLLRVLRIFRIFRILKQFYLLVAGFLDAVSSVVWLSILCGLILYICATMLTRTVGQPDKDDSLAHIKERFFGSVGTSMMTLFQFMAFPDMSKFEDLYVNNLSVTAFLIFFVVFGAFTIVSVLTAVITEAMTEKGRIQQEERKLEQDRAKAAFLRKVKRVLFSADARGYGVLDRSSFEDCIVEILSHCNDQYIGLCREDLEAMFELADYEGTGTVEIEEFLYGMVQLTADMRPMSLMELRKVVRTGQCGMKKQLRALEARTQLIDERVCELLAAWRAGNCVPSPMTGVAPALTQDAAPVIPLAAANPSS